tara:strand:+ start:235 stop:756 length:522 start_codon:yes stop_codon:yes gene_type:complete
MAELQRVMQIIDQNSKALPEGDYLEVCNLLKKSYDTRTDPMYLFKYEDFRIPHITPSSTFHYFYDYYFDTALRTDSNLINAQIRYLEDELETNQPLKRITKRIRDIVKEHCCMMNGHTENELTIEELNLTPTEFKKMCKMYMTIENDFRSDYRNSIIQKIIWLEECEGGLDSF